MGRGPDKRPRKRRTDGANSTSFGQPDANPPGNRRSNLPRGAVQAIRALRHRVPEGTPDPLAEVADEAFDTVVEVMRHGGEGSFARLSAAKVVRDEVCGPVPKAVEHVGDLNVTITTGITRAPDEEEGDDDAA